MVFETVTIMAYPSAVMQEDVRAYPPGAVGSGAGMHAPDRESLGEDRKRSYSCWCAFHIPSYSLGSGPLRMLPNISRQLGR